MLSRSSTYLIMLAVLSLAATDVANAALIRIDFTGTNSSPGAVNVWGTPVPTLNGYVVYESSTPPSGTVGPTATNYNGAIKEVGFTMGDGVSTVFSGSKTGSFGFAQMRDAAGADSISFNNMILSPSELAGEVATVINGSATRTFNNAQLTLNLQGPATSISSQVLLGLFDPALFSTQRQMSVFLSYTTQGSATGWPAVSYNYNFSSVTVAPVPEPVAGTLVMAGLGALGFLARRRVSTSAVL